MSANQSPPRKRVRTGTTSSSINDEQISNTMSESHEEPVASASTTTGRRTKSRMNKNNKNGAASRSTRSTANSNGAAAAVAADSDDSSSSSVDSAPEVDLSGEGCDLSAAVLRKIPRIASGLSKAEGEVVRLIGQYLSNVGLKNSAAVLMAEAGCNLDHSAASTFRKHVLNGEISSAISLLEELQSHLKDPEKIIEMKYLLLEQKYLELLYKGNSFEALKVLQTEITPLKHNQERTHELSSFLMFASKEDLIRVTSNGSADADITDGTTRRNLMDRLQEFLPASIMLPPKRLQTLLNQAAEFQIERCLFHNRTSIAESPFSLPTPPPAISSEFKIDPNFLAVDHQCSKEDFPCETIQTLTEHSEGVWYTKFSPDGRKLASGSKDNTVIIWDYDPATMTLKLNKTFDRHHQVAYFAWSPDSTKIAVCGPEESDEVYIWNVETGGLENKISNMTEDSLVTVSWSPDGRKIACGGIGGQFYQCDTKGTVLDSWEGVRVQCLAYRRDSKSILAADTHNRIRSYNFEELEDQHVLQEDYNIMAFTLDDIDRYALLNVANQGLHLWDIEEKCLVRKFVGVQQGFDTIYSCFGGADQNFIASGSEDNKVYIFHVNRESPIAILEGHSRTVSCVSWNPVYPQVLASASDDGTVRLWGPAKQCRPRQGGVSNGCSNGVS